jgi:hypothetical protein
MKLEADMTLCHLIFSLMKEKETKPGRLDRLGLALAPPDKTIALAL